MKKSALGTYSLLAALGIGLFSFAQTAAHATGPTFASFQEFPGDGNAFVYSNSGATSSISFSDPVLFEFSNPAQTSYTGPYFFGNLILANLTLNGTVSGPTTVNGITYQPFQFVDLTLTEGGHNLLTVTANQLGPSTSDDPAWFGNLGSGNGTLGASVTSGDPSAVSFTSDFINPYYLATEQNFSITFSSATDATTGGQGPLENGNGYLNSFAAAGDGTFGAAPAPEATSAVAFGGMLAVCGAGLFLGARKRKTTNA